MKTKKKKTLNKNQILFLIIILLLSLFFIVKKQNSNNFIQDDIIFFKYFNPRTNQEKMTEGLQPQEDSNNIIIKDREKYYFNVKYKNIDFKEIFLGDTIDKNALVKEKIAPRNKR